MVLFFRTLNNVKKQSLISKHESLNKRQLMQINGGGDDEVGGMIKK